MASQERQIILVVGNEPLQRMAAAGIVEDAGFEALEAADATEAVAMIESRTDVRLVFTDIEMPRGVDGMELAARIRERWPPIDIVVTSGHYSAPDVRLPARGLFFPKP